MIEAGVDVEGTVEPELPAELLAMLQQSPFTREPDINGKSALQNQEASGYLLAWMVAFDLFTDAVRTYPLHMAKQILTDI